MSEFGRRCPTCGEPVLGITSNEELASCPNCGQFFERYRASTSRWPALWIMVLALCGPMLLVAGMRAGQWFALRANQRALFRFFAEAYNICLPLAWFMWPVLCAFLLSRRYAALPDRWMSTIGLTIGALVGNTAIMLAVMLMQVIF